MGEIFFDSFISLPLSDGQEHHQSSRDRHPRRAHRAAPPVPSRVWWPATAPPRRRETRDTPQHPPPLSARFAGRAFFGGV